MSIYFVFQIEIHDPEAYDRYRPLAGPTVEAAGGRYLVRGGAVTVLAGEPPRERVVLLEFPAAEAGLAWYDGEAYAEARAIREAAATTEVFLVEGV